MQYMCRLSLIWFCLPGAWQPILYPVQLHSSINYPPVGVCPDCHRYGSECPGHASQWATLTSRLKTTHIRSSLPYRSQVSAWVAFLTFSHPWLCVCIGDHTSHTRTKLKTTLIQQCWSHPGKEWVTLFTPFTHFTPFTLFKLFTFTLFAFSFCWFLFDLVYINWNQICQTSQVTKYILILNKKLSNVFWFVSIKVFHSHTSICNCHVL